MASAGRQSSRLKAIFFVVLAVGLFSVQDLILKLLSGDYAVTQLVFIRSFVSIAFLSVIVWRQERWSGFRCAKPGLIYLRGLLLFSSFTVYYAALASLPLADTLTAFFAAPLFVTALSVPFLNEHVGGRRWAAVGVGFVGVVLIAKPFGGHIQIAVLFVIAASVLYAMSVILARLVGDAASGAGMTFHMMVFYLIASGTLGVLLGDGRFLFAGSDLSIAFLLREWVLPTASDLALVAVCGVIAAGGFSLLTEAYRVSSPSVVVPFEYTMMPFAILWGFLFFGDLPDVFAIGGILLIIGSGLYIVRRERIREADVVTGGPIRPKA